MLLEEQEQVQHIIQAALNVSQQEDVESLLATIDIRLYSEIFKAALLYIHEHPQHNSSNIRNLFCYLENRPAPYTAEDIRTILQQFNNLRDLTSFRTLMIFPLPAAFEPFIMQPEIFSFCKTKIVGCYQAALQWTRVTFTEEYQYRQILLVGDALLGDEQPGLPGLLRRYAKGSPMSLEEQAQEFLTVYHEEIVRRRWLFINHDLRERMRQAISVPLKIRILLATLRLFSDENFAYFEYQEERKYLLELCAAEPLPVTPEDVLEILQCARKASSPESNPKSYWSAFGPFCTLISLCSKSLLQPETLELCRGDVESLYKTLSGRRLGSGDTPADHTRVLLRRILFPGSDGPLIDYMQARNTSFVTEDDARALLQAYHQEYTNNAIYQLEPAHKRIFKQKFSSHFSVHLIRLACEEILFADQTGQKNDSIYHQNFILIKLLWKKDLPFMPDDVHAILNASKELGASRILVSDFHLFLLKNLAPHLTKPEVLARCRADLEALQRIIPPTMAWNTAMRRNYLLLVTDALSAHQQTISYPLLPDAWGTPIIDELMALDEAQQQMWATLLHHCAQAKEKAPSAAWLEQAQTLSEPIDDEGRIRTVHRWISLFSDRKGERMDDTNSTILRGLIWLGTGSGDHSLANILADAAIEGYRKIPKLGPRSPKVGDAAVITLANMSGLHAIGQFMRVRLHVKQPSYLQGIEQALDEIVRRQQISRTDLEELTVPAFDLQNGQAQFSFGSYRAHLTLNGRKVDLHWFDQDGNELESVPAHVKKAYKEEYDDLKRRVSDIEHMLSTQRLRIERFYLQERHWPLETWQERYIQHPLLSTLSRRLIWQFRFGEQSLQGIWHEERFVDAHNQPLELPLQAEVSLWHPLMSDAQEVQRWRLWLEEHLVTQPFKQAHREVYPLTDTERAAGDISMRFAGHFVRQRQLNAMALTRGWTFALQSSFSGAIQEDPARLELPHLGIRAEWELNLGPNNSNEIPRYVRTAQVYFPLVNTSYPSSFMLLEQVPPIVFSEVMRDIDLFVSVCSAGADPNGNDEPGEIGHYWRTYNQSILSLSAIERKKVLERFVPYLTIAERCTFAGNSLIVRGDLHTYHIHLGSGNIWMEPDNRYLCIVSDKAAQVADEGQFFLPFEGDVLLSLILSKVFLLAEDRQIKDPSIRNQILN